MDAITGAIFSIQIELCKAYNFITKYSAENSALDNFTRTHH